MSQQDEVASYRAAVFKLAFGGLVSTLGSAAASIALTFFIWNQTHSAWWLSGTFLLTWGINGLFQPWLGSLGDRFDRRKVMIIADLAAALLFGAMTFVSSLGTLVAIAFFASFASMAFWPAAVAATPNIVPEGQRAWANGWLSATGTVGRIAGPFLGGAVAAFFGAPWVFAVNGASFLVSAGMTWSVHARFQEERDTAEAHGRQGVGAGFHFIWKSSLLRNITIAWFLLTIAINIAIVADLPLVQSMGRSGASYGLIESAVGVGALIGAWLARSTKERSEWWAILMGSWMTALAYLAVAVSPWYAVLLLASFLVGFSDAFANVAGTTLAQRMTPDEIRSRMFAAWGTTWMAANVISFTIGAPLLDALGPRGLYAFGSAVSVLALAVMFPAVMPLREQGSAEVNDDP